MSFIENTRNDNTFICLPRMKLTIWYQFYCESARLIESWYLMPWDVYCPADTADITILWGSLYHIWSGVRAWLSAKTFRELDLLPWRGWLVVVTENCQMSVLESSLATYALSLSGSWTGICEMVWDSKCLSSRNLLIWQHLSSLSLVSSQSGRGTGPLTLIRGSEATGDDRGRPILGQLITKHGIHTNLSWAIEEP